MAIFDSHNHHFLSSIYPVINNSKIYPKSHAHTHTPLIISWPSAYHLSPGLLQQSVICFLLLFLPYLHLVLRKAARAILLKLKPKSAIWGVSISQQWACLISLTKAVIGKFGFVYYANMAMGFRSINWNPWSIKLPLVVFMPVKCGSPITYCCIINQPNTLCLKQIIYYSMSRLCELTGLN